MKELIEYSYEYTPAVFETSARRTKLIKAGYSVEVKTYEITDEDGKIIRTESETIHTPNG